jgi:hypothetical protein
MSFAGASSALQKTAVVATLDTPLSPGKSAIWCASFQMAWDRLKKDVAKGPVLLKNSEPEVARLNRGEVHETDLPGDGYYAAAGFLTDGIEDRIRRDMAERFPGVKPPEFAGSSSAVAYSYLRAAAKYTYPFFENPDTLIFRDSAGGQTPVSSFGIGTKEELSHRELRHQIAIYIPPKEDSADPATFTVDLCRNTPIQVLLARVGPRTSLRDLLTEAKRCDQAINLGEMGTLLVPNMGWEIDHHFAAVERADRPFLNVGLSGQCIDSATQKIDFRMDRAGVELEAEAKVQVKGGGGSFHLDRPFLIVMKNRGSVQPFFVMWVDNAELLQRRAAVR